MLAEYYKSLVLNYIERIWNRGDIATFDELTTPTFLYRLGGQPGRDHAEMRQFITMMHTAHAFSNSPLKSHQFFASPNVAMSRRFT